MRHRDYKIFSANCYYHLFNRGVGKMDIFRDSDDFKFFLFRLKENVLSIPQRMTLKGRISRSHSPYIRKLLPPDSFSLSAYCLMPNHYHFLIRQLNNLPISKLISKVCTGYSIYFNKKYNHVGGVFQDQYKAVMVESDSQLLWLSSYIHNNPMTAGIISKLQDWEWSSFPDYVGLRRGQLCNPKMIIDMVGSPTSYKKFVEESFIKISERKKIEHLLLDYKSP